MRELITSDSKSLSNSDSTTLPETRKHRRRIDLLQGLSSLPAEGLAELADVDAWNVAAVPRQHRLAFRVHRPAVNLNRTFGTVVFAFSGRWLAGIDLGAGCLGVFDLPCTIGIEAIAVGSLLLRTRIEVGFFAHGDLNRHRIPRKRLQSLGSFAGFPGSIGIEAIAIGSFLLRAGIVFFAAQKLHRLTANLHGSRRLSRSTTLQTSAIFAGVPRKSQRVTSARDRSSDAIHEHTGRAGSTGRRSQMTPSAGIRWAVSFRLTALSGGNTGGGTKMVIGRRTGRRTRGTRNVTSFPA